MQVRKISSHEDRVTHAGIACYGRERGGLLELLAEGLAIYAQDRCGAPLVAANAGQHGSDVFCLGFGQRADSSGAAVG